MSIMMRGVKRHLGIVSVLLFLALIMALMGGCAENPAVPKAAQAVAKERPKADFSVKGKILFVKGGSIWVWDNGNVKQLTQKGHYADPAWSPDGKRIATVVVGENHSDLVILSSDGAPQLQLTNNLSRVSVRSCAWARKPAWSPDGRRLAYASDYARVELHMPLALWLVNSDGTGHRQMTKHPLGSGGVDWPTWSPDGEKIAMTYFEGNGVSQIYTLTLSNGRLVALTNDKEGDYDPAWSPDGLFIAYTARSGGRDDLWIMDAKGTSPQQLTDLGRCRSPAWSPDGQIIAFLAEQGDSFDLYAIKVSTEGSQIVASEVKQLTKGLHIEANSGISWTK
ncbi:MAG: hypothetical protein M1136_05655 [Chloroflexi bacterium]|nr:hypothetical protein [Chloroflexota bacterium]